MTEGAVPWGACASHWGSDTSCSRSNPRRCWQCRPAAPRSLGSLPVAGGDTKQQRPPLVSPRPASSSPTAPRMAHCWALGQGTALLTTSGGGEPATSPQCLQRLVRAAAHLRGHYHCHKEVTPMHPQRPLAVPLSWRSAPVSSTSWFMGLLFSFVCFPSDSISDW